MRAPESLVGFEKGQTAEFLGRPQGMREEGPATVWRYVVDECWMDLFFYADLATGERRVLTYKIEALLKETQGDVKGRCIERIQSVARDKG